MARITVEDCLPYANNRFDLVMLASKRARQLALGSQPLVAARMINRRSLRCARSPRA